MQIRNESLLISNISLSSILHLSKEQNAQTIDSKIKFDKELGLIQLQCKYDNLKDPVLFQKMTFNDPSNHFWIIVDKLRELSDHISSFDLKTILALTFKDIELANMIMTEMRNFVSVTQNFLQPNSEVREITKSLETLEIDIANADVLLARHILEHTEDPQAVLKLFYKILPKNGILILEVPDCSEVYTGNFFKHFWEEHLQYFTKETITNMVSSAGFNVNECLVLNTEAEAVILIIALKTPNISKYSFQVPKNPIQTIYDEIKHLELIFTTLERMNLKIGLIGSTHSNINLVDMFATNPDNYVFFEANPERVGKYVTKHLVQINDEHCPQKNGIDLYISSISAERQFLYYKDFLAKKNITQVFTTDELRARLRMTDLHLLDRRQLLKRLHSRN